MGSSLRLASGKLPEGEGSGTNGGWRARAAAGWRRRLSFSFAAGGSLSLNDSVDRKD